MSKTKAKINQEEIVSEKEANIESKTDSLKIIHEMIIIIAINLLVILLEVFNAYEQTWLSVTMFCILMVGNLTYSWLKRAYVKYLLPLAFVSLTVFGGMLSNAIIVTIVFCIVTIGYFALSFYKKDELETILTILFTGLSLFIFTALMVIDHGFVRVNFELNIVVAIWLAWVTTIAAIIILNRNNYSIVVTSSSISIIFSAICPFLKPEAESSNTFTIMCGISILGISIISILMTYSKDKFNFNKFIGIIFAILIGVIIFSYSFNYSFGLLDTMPNDSQIKAVLVDYILFIPLTIFTVVIFTLFFHRKTSKEISETRSNNHIENNELIKTDGKFVGIYLLFIAISQIMFVEEYELNIVKALIISLLFLGASISLNIRITSIVTIITSLSFFGLMLFIYNWLDSDYILIILMTTASALLIFSVINELFIKGEPLTSTLMISGSLTLMVTSIIYFYLQTYELRYILPGLVWGAIGLFLFTIGVIFNRIVLRRTGLIIILADILYSIIVVILRYRGWQMGVSFIILALVLLGCIYLFRWSEKKKGKANQTDITLAK
ncbi:MAG: hypothetical protein JXA54_05060 [Candidatus Heimdallarchaeota archaeon]|nr:hypothetical protein [Candidatus Heimdallarchaeota archaeon]